MSRRSRSRSSGTGNLIAGAVALGVVLLLVGAVAAVMAYEQVPEGHVGVERVFGDVTGDQYGPGANIVAPWVGLQNVEVRPRTYTMSASQGEGDKSEADEIIVKTVNGSSVGVDLTVRYHIDPERADEFVTEWGDENQMEERLIRPTIRSQLRDEASDLQTTGPGAIYTREGREALASTAQEALEQEFEGQPIVLEAVQVRNIDLPDEIDQTLDEKERAKQQVEVEAERVKQEERRKEQRVIQAEAEAESIRIEGEALRDNPEVIQLRYIEAIDETDKVILSGAAGTGSTPIILDATENETATG